MKWHGISNSLQGYLRSGSGWNKFGCELTALPAGYLGTWGFLLLCFLLCMCPEFFHPEVLGFQSSLSVQNGILSTLILDPPTCNPRGHIEPALCSETLILSDILIIKMAHKSSKEGTNPLVRFLQPHLCHLFYLYKLPGDRCTDFSQEPIGPHK